MKKLSVQISVASSWVWVAILGLLVWALAPIMPPFVMAALMAYVSHPVFKRLRSAHISHAMAAVWVLLAWVLLFVIVVLLVIPLVQREMRSAVDQLPMLIQELKIKGIPHLDGMMDYFHLPSPKVLVSQLSSRMVPSLTQVKAFSDPFVASLQVGGRVLLQWIGMVFLVPLLMFYFMRDGESFYRSALSLVPMRWQAWVEALLNDIDHVLAEFLRGQIAVMLSLAVYYAIGLLIIGLPSAFPIGVLTGFLIFIPYLGYAIGLIIAVLTAALHGADLSVWLGLAFIYGVGQVLEGVFLTPRLVGERVGLHPLALIFALMAFGQLLGFAGVLLAVPVSAALCVVLRRGLDYYRRSPLYQHQSEEVL